MKTSAQKLAILAILTALVYQTWVFFAMPEAQVYIGTPKAPDFRLGGYSPAEFRELLIVWGEHGRNAYLDAQNKIDWLTPALNMALFYSLLWILADGLVVRGRRWSSRLVLAIACIGLLSGFFDFPENILLGQAVRAGPLAFDPGSIEIASVLTQLKWYTMFAAWALIATLGFLRFRQLTHSTPAQ